MPRRTGSVRTAIPLRRSPWRCRPTDPGDQYQSKRARSMTSDVVLPSLPPGRFGESPPRPVSRRERGPSHRPRQSLPPRTAPADRLASRESTTSAHPVGDSRDAPAPEVMVVASPRAPSARVTSPHQIGAPSVQTTTVASAADASLSPRTSAYRQGCVAPGAATPAHHQHAHVAPRRLRRHLHTRHRAATEGWRTGRDNPFRRVAPAATDNKRSRDWRGPPGDPPVRAYQAGVPPSPDSQGRPGRRQPPGIGTGDRRWPRGRVGPHGHPLEIYPHADVAPTDPGDLLQPGCTRSVTADDASTTTHRSVSTVTLSLAPDIPPRPKVGAQAGTIPPADSTGRLASRDCLAVPARHHEAPGASFAAGLA